MAHQPREDLARSRKGSNSPNYYTTDKKEKMETPLLQVHSALVAARLSLQAREKCLTDAAVKFGSPLKIKNNAPASDDTYNNKKANSNFFSGPPLEHCYILHSRFFSAQKPIFRLPLLLPLPLPLLKPWLLLVALYYGFMDWVTRALPMYSSSLSLLVLNFVPPNGLSLLLPFSLSFAM
ncbi:hypothetical protein H0E87_009458 [Populus deltoides]|uniref:Uncharacterized protein n=1 Tax=Populus deltoides TaxID=3696 RepID=A0A8T2Z4I2_POPDE|nr:hypothetical protein H0E87_009458 [Populus deltoides]